MIAQQAVGACIAAMREMETQQDTAIARCAALLSDPRANACGGRCRKESSERRRLHHLLMEFRGNVRVFCRCVCELVDLLDVAVSVVFGLSCPAK